MIEPGRLVGFALFGGFSPDELAALASLLTERRHGKGESLWPADSVNNDLCFILEGNVELSCKTEFEERRAVMGMFSPGSIVGEASFFGGDGCFISAMAVDSLTVAALSREGIAELARTSPTAHVKLLDAVLTLTSRRIVQAYKRLASIF